jgi:hypothetical protein
MIPNDQMSVSRFDVTALYNLGYEIDSLSSQYPSYRSDQLSFFYPIFHVFLFLFVHHQGALFWVCYLIKRRHLYNYMDYILLYLKLIIKYVFLVCCQHLSSWINCFILFNRRKYLLKRRLFSYCSLANSIWRKFMCTIIPIQNKFLARNKRRGNGGAYNHRLILNDDLNDDDYLNYGRRRII